MHPFSLVGEKKKLNTSRISYTRETFARSLCGLPAFVLTVTGERNKSSVKERKCIVITSRVSAGETTSSFAVEGFVNFLLCTHNLLRRW